MQYCLFSLLHTNIEFKFLLDISHNYVINAFLNFITVNERKISSKVRKGFYFILIIHTTRISSYNFRYKKETNISHGRIIQYIQHKKNDKIRINKSINESSIFYYTRQIGYIF